MLEVLPIGVPTVIAAVRSQFEDREAAALLQCAAQATGATAIMAIAAMAIAVTV
ncbi:hypothetical protein [Bradyrhizobium sp. BWC-3-1]|uniref:hypothetical protein n=1 Tax=Bradyrhizobium sp. BWC-3-1 TaxID=3080012 RepID=UPI00293F02BE|nr:hypothetical protein [Bradyrhizobium sp. BWC-3-1]WOH60330.1 hypothetical protein RX329_09620 [Bradyrhizobium sp. BWC-3-1]